MGVEYVPLIVIAMLFGLLGMLIVVYLNWDNYDKKTKDRIEKTMYFGFKE